MSDGKPARNRSAAYKRQKEKRVKEMEKSGDAHSVQGVTGALHSTHESPPQERRRAETGDEEED